MTQPLRRLLLLVALLLLPLGAAAAAPATEIDGAPPIAPFRLVDSTGMVFDNRRLAGRWSLVAIGFTNCPDVCPFTLSNLEAVYTELALHMTPERRPQVIFVGVDPERDAAILGDYVGFFHPDFVGVTGDKDQIDVVVAGIDGFYRLNPPDANGNYTVDHTTFVALVDGDGRLRAKLTLPMEPAEVSAYILGMQRQPSGAE
jgi:protein SCO1/2